MIHNIRKRERCQSIQWNGDLEELKAFTCGVVLPKHLPVGMWIVRRGSEALEFYKPDEYQQVFEDIDEEKPDEANKPGGVPGPV